MIDTDRNTSTVIYNGNRIIFIDKNTDFRTITGKRFINGIVYYFIYKMM